MDCYWAIRLDRRKSRRGAIVAERKRRRSWIPDADESYTVESREDFAPGIEEGEIAGRGVAEVDLGRRLLEKRNYVAEAILGRSPTKARDKELQARKYGLVFLKEIIEPVLRDSGSRGLNVGLDDCFPSLPGCLLIRIVQKDEDVSWAIESVMETKDESLPILESTLRKSIPHSNVAFNIGHFKHYPKALGN